MKIVKKSYLLLPEDVWPFGERRCLPIIHPLTIRSRVDMTLPDFILIWLSVRLGANKYDRGFVTHDGSWVVEEEITEGDILDGCWESVDDPGEKSLYRAEFQVEGKDLTQSYVCLRRLFPSEAKMLLESQDGDRFLKEMGLAELGILSTFERMDPDKRFRLILALNRVYRPNHLDQSNKN